MATKSDKSEEEPEAHAEPERAVDPPEAKDTEDKEKRSPRQWVQATETATLTLPSGASYSFSAGNVELLQAEDAAFMVENGYGTKTGKPSGE